MRRRTHASARCFIPAPARWQPLIGRILPLLLVSVAGPAFDAFCAAQEEAAAAPAIVRTTPVAKDAAPAAAPGIVRTAPATKDAEPTAGEKKTGPLFGMPSKNGLVTNAFYDSELREALRDVGDQAGVTIIATEEVKGLVTLLLADTPLDKALELMLAGTGYIVTKRPDYYLVCSSKPDTPSFHEISETRLIRLNYFKSAKIMQLLPQALKQYMSADDENNCVSVSAPPKILETITAFLEKLDQQPQQVMFDVNIVVMEDSKALDLGLHGKWPTLQAGSFSGSDLHGTGSATTALPGGVPWPWGIKIGYAPDKSFTDALALTLTTLSETNQATIIAHPQIMAQDGTEAEIKVMTEEYFNIVTNSTYYVKADLEKIEVGTKLKILPRIAKDGSITLKLTAEVSDVVARGADNLPIVTRRETTNELRVEDGGTAVIAGLMDNSTRLVKNAVPGLSKIGGVGKLFSNKNKTEVSKQIYVFVTPRLLAAKASEAEPAPTQTAQAPETAPAALAGKEFQKELAESLKRLGTGQP